MPVQTSIGSSIIGNVRDIVSKNKEKLENKCYSRYIESRKYEVCRISGTRLQYEILKIIYNFLKNYSISLNFNIELARNSIKIYNNSKKDLWYSLGLALADASLIGRSSVLFSTTQSCIINAFFEKFPYFSISIPRYYVSTITGKISPVFNVFVKWRELADLLWKVKKEKNLSVIFNNIKYNKEQFLAGIIDGDGVPDEDNLRISTSSNDVLYTIISQLFDGEIVFDAKRFIIRVKTRKLRETVDLKRLPELIHCYNKKIKIKQLASKRRRYELNIDIGEIKKSIDFNKINLIRHSSILFRFKVRYHKGYKYLYITYNKYNNESIFKELDSFVRKMKIITNLDIRDSIKSGKREFVIYNQNIVNLILYLRNLLESRIVCRTM